MPTSERFEPFVQRQIREAAERGEFDDLPGSGGPIEDLDPDYDPEWWAKRFITREQVRDRADELRRMIRAELPRLRSSSDVAVVEARVTELNRMIAAVNEDLDAKDHVQPISL
jgi:hypothetical protein